MSTAQSVTGRGAHRSPRATADRNGQRPLGLALIVIAAAQLMVVLDGNHRAVTRRDADSHVA
jgi:hypothetical protein